MANTEAVNVSAIGTKRIGRFDGLQYHWMALLSELNRDTPHVAPGRFKADRLSTGDRLFVGG